MSQTFKIGLGVLITALVTGTVVYFWQRFQYQPMEVVQNNLKNQLPNVPSVETPKDLMKVNIMVPKDYEKYRKEMTEFSQIGGEDPLRHTEFFKKEVLAPLMDDVFRASADAAAKELSVQGGQSEAKVTYFKIKNNTAYVFLNIDIDGWAGVSVIVAIIHPVVEKTLRQFPEIQNVVFGYAPEDKP